MRFSPVKRAVLVSLALAPVGVCLLAAPADDVLPRSAAADRYAKMADRSPFAPPTAGPVVAAATPPPPGPKWSDSLSVSLITQQGGTYFATIFDKSKNEHFLLQSDKPDTDRQMIVASVQWGDLADETVVKLRHNNDLADLHFEAGTSSGSPAVAAPIPGRPLGGVPTLPPGLGGGQPRLTPPPPPPGLPPGMSSTVQRRQAPIRTTPTVTAPPSRPPVNLPRRPVEIKDDDE